MAIFSDKLFFLVTGPTFVCEEGGLSAKRVDALTKKIERNGGQICDEMADADVWLVDSAVLPTYQLYCNSHPRHRVEGSGFIQACIENKGWYEEPVEAARPMRGRVPGRRNDFTDKERELLCSWLAMKIPDKAAGGRYGNAVYKELEATAQRFPDDTWGAARSHPWSSWREHYKKNSAELDPLIEEIVVANGFTPNSKTAYHVDRRANKRLRVRYAEEEEDDEAQQQEQEERGEFSDTGSESEDEQPVKKKPARRDVGRSAFVVQARPPVAGPSRPARQPEISPEVDVPASPSNTQRTLVNPTQPMKRKRSSGQQHAPRPEQEVIVIDSESEAYDDEEIAGPASGGRLSGSSAGTVRASSLNPRGTIERSQSPASAQQEVSRATTVSANAVEGILDDDDNENNDEEEARSQEFSSGGSTDGEQPEESDASDASDDARAAEDLV